MNRFRALPLCVSFGLISSVVTVDSARANLVINGGFELGAPLGGSPAGHGDLPSPWTSSAPLNFLISYDTWENTGTTGIPPNTAALYTGVVAPEGVRWAGGFDFEEMGQLLQSPLTPGQEYTFSAFVRSSHGREGSFEIWLGTSVNTYTTQVAILPPNTGFVDGWELQTAIFIAPANVASTPWLTFKSYQSDPEFGNGTYMGIDDVRLVATPEPATIVLWSLAFVGITGIVRFARCKR
ncbi:MAG: hypothetical protein WD851_21685 [Pirellulales bacterium]